MDSGREVRALLGPIVCLAENKRTDLYRLRPGRAARAVRPARTSPPPKSRERQPGGILGRLDGPEGAFRPKVLSEPQRAAWSPGGPEGGGAVDLAGCEGYPLPRTPSPGLWKCRPDGRKQPPPTGLGNPCGIPTFPQGYFAFLNSGLRTQEEPLICVGFAAHLRRESPRPLSPALLQRRRRSSPGYLQPPRSPGRTRHAPA